MSGPISARISRFHNQYTFKETGAENKEEHQSGCGTELFCPRLEGGFVLWARKTLMDWRSAVRDLLEDIASPVTWGKHFTLTVSLHPAAYMAYMTASEFHAAMD